MMTDHVGTLAIDSPVGRILLAACAEGLTHLVFIDREGRPQHAHRSPEGDRNAAAARILAETEKQLREYFAGRRRGFDLPLAPQGTEFQKDVWRALSKIPFGHTISYRDLALKIGRESATRAVGAANGANPISIILPCHRVIGADNRLTGYGGGLPAKKYLLELEGAKLDGDRVVQLAAQN